MIQTYAVRTVTDNYEPPRGEAWLTATLYVDEERPAASMRHPVLVLDDPGAQLRDGVRAVYLWDDGVAVTPYYVAGWHGATADSPDRVTLHPVAPQKGEGSNLRTWALGPARCYHLKAQRTNPKDDNV